jgi:hypothetical protein
MEEHPIVVLFGDSLLMDTVEASLGAIQGLGVLRVYNSVTDIADRLRSYSPDLIIFELGSTLSKTVIPLLIDQPGVPLLGVDITSSRVVVLSSQQHTVLTANDLDKLIRSQTNGKAGELVQPQGAHLMRERSCMA